MLQFLKFVLATIVGLILFFFLTIIVLVGIGSAGDPEKPNLKDNAVLKLSLDRPLVEISNDPFEELNLPGMQEGKESMVDILAAIENAKREDKVKGIFLDMSATRAGFAQLEEIRNALLDFKESKKFIYAYGDYYAEGAYYLASVADSIFLYPEGAMEFNGLFSEIPFIKGTLEKLEVKPIIFRVGEFKSAVEPFILDKMSPENKLQTMQFIGSINTHYMKSIAESRNIPYENLKRINDSMLVQEPEEAVQYGLVSKLAYLDQVHSSIKKKLGIKEDEKFNMISAKTMAKVKGKPNTSDNKIAVIVAQGEIVDGKGEDDNIGSVKFAEEIRKARKDKNVKAVVLRVNSPGGSALASDVIWREITLTKQVKPIVASMSSVAASGGYYISMNCNKIVAQPTTITGSIGVFGLLFNAEGLLKNKLGVTTDRVKTGEFADLGNGSRPMSEAERQIIQKSVNRIYEVFTSKAASGRNMDVEALKKLAGGRVWSGIDAKEQGLVDEYGGLNDAVKLAAKEAKLKEGDYRLKYSPQTNDIFKQIMESLSGETEARLLQAYLGEHYNLIRQVKDIHRFEGIQARLPFDLEIR
jgi:protease-4